MVSSGNDEGSGVLTHIGAGGEARMVDVSGKDATSRVAVAEGRVRMGRATLETILAGDAKKGDVIGAARIAGIMAAKRTAELIPLCHPLQLSKIEVDIAPDEVYAGPEGSGGSAVLRPDWGGNGGADRGRRRMPHHLRHGEGD